MNNIDNGIDRAQAGVALITALLVVALTTIAAVAMASRQQIDIRRTANVINGDQAYTYAVAIETWAIQALVRDKEETEIDHLKETWNLPLNPIEVNGGEVVGRIEDLQGRFNLNSLVGANGQPNQNVLLQLQRLLTLLDIPPELSFTIADWIDPDLDAALTAGAEDVDYLGLEIPYRTPNAPMVSVSELRFIQGMEPEFFQKLSPLVCALPGPATLNINTAPLPVIMSVADDLSPAAVELLLQARETEPFEDVTEFIEQLKAVGAIEPEQASKLAQGSFGVASDYFQLTAQAKFGRGQATLLAIVQRDADGARIIARGLGAL